MIDADSNFPSQYLHNCTIPDLKELVAQCHGQRGSIRLLRSAHGGHRVLQNQYANSGELQLHVGIELYMHNVALEIKGGR